MDVLETLLCETSHYTHVSARIGRLDSLRYCTGLHISVCVGVLTQQ